MLTETDKEEDRKAVQAQIPEAYCNGHYNHTPDLGNKGCGGIHGT